MAVMNERYNKNQSMKSEKSEKSAYVRPKQAGVDATPIYDDSDSDDGWSD
jgi:hypothetical protein